nr:MAG TPA: hypothetical protein [Crassvirales sp.]
MPQFINRINSFALTTFSNKLLTLRIKLIIITFTSIWHFIIVFIYFIFDSVISLFSLIIS